MVLATIYASPLFLEALHLSEGPSNEAGIPLWIVPVIIFIILALVFLSSYFGSTGIQGMGGESTAVSHDDHDEPATRTAVLPVEEVAAVIEPDNLKLVEGIGPKIEGVLHEAGILTFAQLAASAVGHLEKVVREDAGIRVAFPDTWPEQAQLAADGLWDALEKLQGELKGGRRA